METSSKIRKLSEIIDKYRVHNRLYCGPMSKKMICVRLYAAAASGTRSVDIIKKMVGDAPMEEYLLPEDYENWKRLISESQVFLLFICRLQAAYLLSRKLKKWQAANNNST